MEGLSRRKRNFYFSVLTLIFLIAAPLIALYATGYRISSEFKLIETGGIHVDVQRSGAQFYLDGSFEGEGTLFQKSFFKQNLTPGVYAVRVEREGFVPWEKRLEVFSTVITEARSFLVPEDLEFEHIPQTVERVEEETTEGTKITRPIPNLVYEEIVSAFTATSTGISNVALGATTSIQYRGATTTVYAQDSIGLWQDDEGLHAWWLNGEDELPYAFCRHNECQREIVVWEPAYEIRHFDFLPDDNLFILLERLDGIYLTEVDTREPQNVFALYPTWGAQMRVIEDTIYILDDVELFELTL